MKRPSEDAVVELREVTEENLHPVLRLQVHDTQKRFVAPNSGSIAEAHFSDKAWFRAIYADEVPVGFAMLSVDTEEPEYFLWRFMIDVRYQGWGFGRRALDLLVDHVRTLPGATELLTSVVEGEGGPHDFYVRCGFESTDRFEDDERLLRLAL